MVDLNIAIQFLDPTESQATCLKITAMHLYFEKMKSELKGLISEGKKPGDQLLIKWHSINDFGFVEFGDFIREIGVFLNCDDDIVYLAMNAFKWPYWDNMSQEQMNEFVENMDLFDQKLLWIRNIIDQCLPKQEFIDPNGKKIGNR